MGIILDTDVRTAEITDAISRLVIEGGFGNVTMRKIVRQLGMSTGTLNNHLDNKERMLRVCCSVFSTRRLQRLTRRVTELGVPGLLPAVEASTAGLSEDLLLERVWRGWRELARSEAGIARTVALADSHERHLLLRALVPEVPEDPRAYAVQRSRGLAPEVPSDPELDLVWAAIDGVRERVCVHPDVRLAPERTQQLLAAVAALARRSATIASGSAAE